MKFNLEKFKAGVSAYDDDGDENVFVSIDNSLAAPLVYKWREFGDEKWIIDSKEFEDVTEWTMKSEPVIRWALKVQGSLGVDFWHSELSTHDNFFFNDKWHDHLILKTKKIILESDDET